jgi:hypothetical protein
MCQEYTKYIRQLGARDFLKVGLGRIVAHPDITPVFVVTSGGRLLDRNQGFPPNDSMST